MTRPEGKYTFVGKEGVSSNSRSQLTPRYRRKVNMWDYDGVVREGAVPGEYDVIITGRTFEEAPIVFAELQERGITNVPIYFNPIHLKDRQNHNEFARRKSGKHKAAIISLLKANDVNLGIFSEDDPIQAEEILAVHPEIEIVMYPWNPKNNEDE